MAKGLGCHAALRRSVRDGDPGRAGSYEQACGTLFDWADMRFGWQWALDPAGFSRARKHLTVSECLKVFTLASVWAANNLEPVAGPIAGRPLVAVDGMILHLPRANWRVHGLLGPQGVGALPSGHAGVGLGCRASGAVGMAADAPRPGRTNDLPGHAEAPADGCRVLLDRGYPSHDVLEASVTSGRDAVMRMVASEVGGSWKPVADFLAIRADISWSS